MPRREVREGWSSTTKWVLAAVLSLPLCCCGGGAVMGLRLWTEGPRSAALDRVTNHPAVIDALGAPVSGDVFFSGNFNVTEEGGLADVRIGLSGSKRDGVLHVKGVRTAQIWGFSRLRVVADDGRVINVVGNR